MSLAAIMTSEKITRILGSRNKSRIKFHFITIRFSVTGIIIEDDPHPALCSQGKQLVHDHGFVEIIGKDVKLECIIIKHFIQKLHDSIPSLPAEVFMDFLVGKGLFFASSRGGVKSIG